MLSNLKLWFENLLGHGFKVQLEAADSLLSVSLRGSESIRKELDRALDLVNALRKAGDEEKSSLVQEYNEVLVSIDGHAAAAQAGGKSLIDGSHFDWMLSEGSDARWLRKLDHMSLTIDKVGLDLPVGSELDNRDVLCDEAQRRIAGAIKTVNKASSRFTGHRKALGKRLDQMGEVSVGAAVPLPAEAKESVREIAQIVVIALTIAIVFRSFLFQPFHIPSGSMKPTLLVGDYLFVSKYSYGFSHKSFPFGVDFFNGRVFNRVPQRDDVIVFKLTSDGRTDYIKRLVGLPGDKIQVNGGVLYINDVAVPKTPDGYYAYTDDLTGQHSDVSRFSEVLPNGAVHPTLDMTMIGRQDNTSIYRVPEKHYFFMGDNRDNSQDSRVIGGGVGFVPEENLVGRAEVIFLSVDGSAKLWQIWRWPTAIRYSRLFKKIS